MFRFITALIIIFTSFTIAQDITNTLGVDGTFKVKNSSSTDLLHVTSSGAATINGTATVNGATTINGNTTVTGKITVTNGPNTYSLPTIVAGANKVISSNSDGTSSWVDNKKQSIKFIICYDGEYPQRYNLSDQPISATGHFIGEILMTAATDINRIPGNFFECNGQLLLIQNYSALYSVIGTTYGGDGSTTFALPNFTNTMPIGQ
jgi:microcystin-dependent protein